MEQDLNYASNVASLCMELVEAQRNLMVSVSTGGPRIEEVDDEYKRRRDDIRGYLTKLKLEDPNPYRSLWDWYGHWSSGELPSYKSRRVFIRTLYEPLLSQLESLENGVLPAIQRAATGWDRVDRGIDKMRTQLAAAKHEEDFQQVGLLAREVLISVAQSVFDAERHPTTDGVEASKTDAKRMLEAYIASEFSGKKNEELRRHAKGSLALAVALQHERTATYRLAALCTEATSSVANTVAILSGRYDPPVDGHEAV